MNGVLWDQSLSKINKKIIYNTIINKFNTYGSEVGQMKERMKQFEGIRDIMGVTHTLVDDRQLVLYGHVQLIPNERLPKQIFTWKQQGRGTPKRSWRKGIDKETREGERKLQGDLWLNRDQWQL